MSLAAYQIAGFLCVNDANLVALNNGEKSATDIVVRGCILPDKCQ